MISAVAGTSWQRLPTSFNLKTPCAYDRHTSPFHKTLPRNPKITPSNPKLHPSATGLSRSPCKRIYDNKAVMSLLGIKDRYLKNLRDNGSLGHSRYGDKYWYTQTDIDRFLSRFHFDPFADKYSMK